ncbi:conserved exported protein of unknown function [Nitrospira moscoviensis]|uniref:Lipoprotein LPP20-like domain-containing protein n=2 Tax=Nitrospira moscoviensis TaxID=42253 RepID=A0A0K2GFE9_NITMO|nr:conserved exported protein of unknown function [Nitrospira moscoviensis]
MSLRPSITALLGCWMLVLSLSGCGWFGGGKAKPGWVEGTSADYPPAQYLIGVGQADNRNAAADQAYAAVARIFKAEVAAQAKDWESYLVVENRGSADHERRLTLDSVTKVSTDKILENVRILDNWYDLRKGLHYALAAMHRPQAEASLMERITTLDRTVEADVRDARQASDKLLKVRNLRRAARNLVLREAYNADLRVVRPSGQGLLPPYRVNELTNELEQFLAANLALAVQVSGDHAEPIQRALSEGLIREGLYVASGTVGPEGAAPELVVRGTVRLWPIEVRDPQFKYVRWCSDFEVVEPASQRVVGAVSRGGKEGHLTEREATAKALRVIQKEFSTDLARAVAAHIYGEADLPQAADPPAGCPRDDPSMRPIR